VARGAAWQARAALLKGLIMAAFGAGVLVQVTLKLVHGLAPSGDVMGAIGLLALVANLACLGLLWARRGDDINMRSAWVCSRNDVVGNVAVLLAAALVLVTGSPWPDVIVGLAVAALVSQSAVRIVREATRQLVVD
jgi:Co/Zn/Cd efflux system component